MKLSLIVPIYNVKPYLHKCVDSLLAQDYEDYEIILVDDGSTDGSGELADQLASSPNIRVIHQENQGLSGARNAGIEVANGEYICFVDSDDYWEPNVLGGLMAQIERDQLDVLRFNFQMVRRKAKGDEAKGDEAMGEGREDEYEVFEPNKNSHAFADYSSIVVGGEEFLNDRMSAACYAWQFVLRAELVKGERFTEGRYYEDTDWTPRMLLRPKRVASTDTVVYNYLQRVGSITQSVSEAKRRKIIEDKLWLIDSVRTTTKGSRWGRFMEAFIVQTILNEVVGDFYGQRVEILKRLKEKHVRPLSMYHTRWNAKVKYIMINMSMRAYVWLMHARMK